MMGRNSGKHGKFIELRIVHFSVTRSEPDKYNIGVDMSQVTDIPLISFLTTLRFR